MAALTVYESGLVFHFPEGWFVVGAGRNGMEYSVLLIAVLAALAWARVGHTRRQPESLP